MATNRPKTSERFACLITIVLLLGLGGTGVAQQPATDACRIDVTTDTVNGVPAEQVAPPSGSTGADSLRLTGSVLFGGDCVGRLNTPPLLLGGWTTYMESFAPSLAYHVTYVDHDNDPPVSIVARLDGGEPKAMRPDDPGDADYTDGARFSAFFNTRLATDNVLVPAAGPGWHHAILQAHDGHAPAEDVRVEGPYVTLPVMGALELPNPTNRLFIHPIANGPTFVPPSEILPPLGRVAGGEANGVYSYVFPIDPVAAAMRPQWSVGAAADFILRNYGQLEGQPGPDADFEVDGAARPDARAHVGVQSVDLAPPGAVADAAGFLGGVTTYPLADLAIVHMGVARVHYQADDGTNALRVLLQADQDQDGTIDLCLEALHLPTPAASWKLFQIRPETPLRPLLGDCADPDPLHGPDTLENLQNDPRIGLARVKSLRLEAVTTPETASSGSLLVDSLALISGLRTTDADIDICFYGTSELPESPLTPIECVSDIGPHDGDLPEAATHAAVWADRMMPMIRPENLVPERPYLEPAVFGFSLTKWRGEGPDVIVPEPPRLALRLHEDLDRDGDAGSADPLLAIQDLGRPDAAGHTWDLQIPFDRPDGSYAFVVSASPTTEAWASATALHVQRFVNDAPVATLSGELHPHPRHTVTFYPAAQDEDLSQADPAPRLGGLTSWRLDFGDGSTPAQGGSPLPATIEHTYRRHADYTAVLTVWDAAGASAEARLLLSIGGHARWSADIE